MQLSVLQSETRRLLGGVSSADYASADITSSVNRHIHTATVSAILATGEWEVHNAEIATANLVANQKEYVFPSDLITLKGVEVNLTGSTNGWANARIVDKRTKQYPFSNTAFPYGFGSPEIDLFDDSLFFLVAPAQNSTDGLKLYYNKLHSELSGSSDTPRFPEFLHVGLVYGACWDFYLSKPGLEARAREFERLTRDTLETKLKEYYANRLPAKRIQIQTRRERFE